MFLELQQYSSLIGKKPSGFTEHYYTEWDGGLDSEKITLFLVLSVGSTQVPGDEIGKEAFQLLQDHFLDDLEGDPYDRFESALKEINLMVSEKEKELDLKFVPNVHVICGVLQKDNLFLSQRGEAQGYLVRKRHTSSITDDLYDPKNKEDLFQNIASGQLEVGDSVVLVTGPLVQFVSPSEFSKIFSEQALHEAGKELKELLHDEIEEQMAMLSFEVLEKSHEPHAVAPVRHHQSIDEDYEDDYEEEVPKNSKQKRILESLKVLRDTAMKHERTKWLGAKFSQVKKWEQKKLLAAIGGTLVVVVLGVFLLRMTTGQQRLLEEMQGKLDFAEESITQAETRGSFDKAEASELLNTAETLAVEVLNSDVLRAEASQLLDRIDEQRDYLDNVVRVDDELTLLADFSDLLGSATIQGVVPYNDAHLVYTENEAYSVLIDDVQNPITVDQTDQILAATYFADRDNIVMVTDGPQVIEYTDGNAQLADTSDVEWQDGVAVSTYSSRIYLLDSEEGQIWRYQRGTAAYGGAQAYIDADEIDLKGAVSIAIDGAIWVLKDDGSILQLLSGEEIDFSIQKSPLGSMEGATKIFTELESNKFYVLDPVEKRLLVYAKSVQTNDLTYDLQYVFDNLKGTLKDFYIDKDRDAIVLVTDQALYELAF